MEPWRLGRRRASAAGDCHAAIIDASVAASVKAQAAIALGLVCATACHRAASPRRRNPVSPVSSVRIPQPSKPPSVVSAAKKPPAPTNIAPATIACGKTACRAGSEVCCTFASTHWCAKLSSSNQDLRTLGTACIPPPGVKSETDDNSDVEFATCDDSDDCASGQRCCLFGGFYDAPYMSVCTRKGDDCNAELCRPGTCRGRLHQCRRERGQRARCVSGTPLRCGRTVCSDRKWVCRTTAKDARCATLKDAKTEMAWQCIRPGDCPRGTKCCVEGNQAECNQNCDYWGGTNACDTDADCPPVIIMGKRKQRRCVALSKALPTTAPPGFTRVCEFK